VNDAHARYEQDLGAYVLGALEQDESRVVEDHLEGCAHCRAELERLRLPADALPRSVLQVEPPPSLRQSLMAEVYGEAPRERRRWRDLLPDLGGARPQLAWVSAAFLLAVGIACGWGITQLAGSDDARVISAQVDDRRVPSASASLVVPDDSDSGAILRVNGMPTLPPGRVYQVWIQRGRELTPGTLFNVGEDGTGTPAVRSVDDAEAVLVTREVAGGARAPSEDPILRVRL
jgi:anti-sigma factor RsiW